MAVSDPLFGRVIIVTADALRVKNLRMAFKVEKDLKPSPNKCELKIFNLNDEHQRDLTRKDVQLIIEAGYGNNAEKIFTGTVRSGIPEKTGTDIIMSMQCGDGQDKMRSRRVSQSFAKGVKIADVLDKLVDATGLGTDKAKKTITSKIRNGSSVRGALTEYVNGASFDGLAYEQLNKVLGSCGYQASVQDGEIQILELNKATQDTAIVLSASSGLKGSPSIGATGIIKAKALLQPSLLPGRKVIIQSRDFNGTVRIDKLTHQGDNFANDFETEIEGREVKSAALLDADLRFQA